LAKALSALDELSDGRVIAGVGPGSSRADYDAVGVPFEQRWQRFDETSSRSRPCSSRHLRAAAPATARRPRADRGRGHGRKSRAE
jgi:hypothetical protein